MGQRLIFGYVMSLFLSDFDLIFALFVWLCFLSAQVHVLEKSPDAAKSVFQRNASKAASWLLLLCFACGEVPEAGIAQRWI